MRSGWLLTSIPGPDCYQLQDPYRTWQLLSGPTVKLREPDRAPRVLTSPASGARTPTEASDPPLG